MTLIVEQGFDPTKFNADKANQSVSDMQVTPAPDVIKRDTGKVDTGKVDTGKVDTRKVDDKKPEDKKPDTVKKHGSYVDRIIQEKDHIELLLINGIQFYTQFFTYLSKFDINEEAIQRLFSTKLKTKQHAQYCDLVLRIGSEAMSSSKLGKSITANHKKYNYFLSRNKTSTSVDYLFSFYSNAMVNGFDIKSLRGIFNNSDFVDYVWDDIDQKTKNMLITKGIIEVKSNKTYTVPYYTMTDEYIIQLVDLIYKYNIYGTPKNLYK